MHIISVFVIAEQLDWVCHHDISMLQSVYTVLAMEETTKSLRMSFHLYTATTTHKIDFNLNILMHGHRQCEAVH